MGSLLLLSLVSGVLVLEVSWGKCIHDDIAVTNQVFGSESDIRMTASSRDKRDAGASSLGEEAYQPLRIHVHYMETVLLSEDRQDVVKRAMQQAVRKIQSVLSVIPVRDPLLLPRIACEITFSGGINKGRCSRMPKGFGGELCLKIFKIPDDHLEAQFLYNKTYPLPVREYVAPGPGVKNADLILYVGAVDTQQCLLKDQSILAFASHCRVDERGRPVAGLINFCPFSVMRSAVTQDLIYTTALHEMIHVLGFSVQLFGTFLDCKGEECKESAFVKNDHRRHWLIPPTVVNRTRQHFGCHSEDIFGGLLQTKNFAATSHWDSLMMYTSLMTPEVENVSYHVLDPITLAVLEDSGWYKVNFSNADPFLWGKGAGCWFALPDHCQKNEEYFCFDNSSGCHFLLRDKALCDAFKTNRTCGVYAPFPKGSCTQNIAESADSSLEIFSSSSRCFLSSVTKEPVQSGGEELVGQCYRRQCLENGTVLVRLQGTGWTPCPPGQSIQISGFTGHIQCPNNTDILCIDDFLPLSPASPPQGGATSPADNPVTVTTVVHYPTQSVANGATRKPENLQCRNFFVVMYLCIAATCFRVNTE